MVKNPCASVGDETWRHKESDTTECLHTHTYIKPYMYRASFVDQMVKNPPATQEIWVRSLGGEEPLEEGMAIQSSILV